MVKDKFDEILMNLIKKRRSVRVFNGKKIQKNDILSIIEAGIWAPTGCNNQELRFFILDTEEQIEGIIRFKPFLKGMSTFILVFSDMSLDMSLKAYGRKSGKHLPYIDTGLALMNMVLYAKSKNIDSCICNFSEYHIGIKSNRKKNIFNKIINGVKFKLNPYSLHEYSFIFYLRNHLKIPNHLKIMCGVALGYAEKYPDIETFKHGGKRIMRKDVKHYILDWY